MTGTLPPLLDSVVGGGTPGRSCIRVVMDPMLMCPGSLAQVPHPLRHKLSYPRHRLLNLRYGIGCSGGGISRTRHAGRGVDTDNEDEEDVIEVDKLLDVVGAVSITEISD
ncbi:hypothetical protein TNCV_2585881 [Trichonephila clavipes]|nr:hypothetical protein TNCV_2585881 [Trichonephila clavipes]